VEHAADAPGGVLRVCDSGFPSKWSKVRSSKSIIFKNVTFQPVLRGSSETHMLFFGRSNEYIWQGGSVACSEVERPICMCSVFDFVRLIRKDQGAKITVGQ
jgi:hypothetical protein